MTAMAMLFAAGTYLKQLAYFIPGAIITTSIIVYFEQNRFLRVMEYLIDPTQVHQTWQALIGIARGGWFGNWAWWWYSKNTAYYQNHKTDMIFAIIGEELGILGMLFVLLSYALYIRKKVLTSRK